MECRPDQIALYVEGELAPRAAASLLAHITYCPACQERLCSEQALARALDELPGLAPPENFASTTVSRARADVSYTLRNPSERRRAYAIAGGLSVLTVALLWPTGLIYPLLAYLAPVRCMTRIAICWTTNAGISAFVVARTLARKLIDESALPWTLAVAAAAALVVLLVWVVVRLRHMPSPR
jgi:anti-sigma factor RsiW